LALGHLITTVLLACTIVRIPFAWAHVKLAGLALWPIGKMIVPHRTHPCDTRAGGDAIMLSCRNEMTRRTGGGGTSKKTEGVKLRPAERSTFAKCHTSLFKFANDFKLLAGGTMCIPNGGGETFRSGSAP
jgi:hypothetical protein